MDSLPRCSVDDEQGPCGAPPATITPLPLCERHRLIVALDATPQALARLLGVDFPAQTCAPKAESAQYPQPASLPNGAIPRRHEPLVYFILNGSRIKIGYSRNLSSRLESLAVRQDSVLLLLKGSRRLEVELHYMFEATRHQDTEWFDLSAALIRYIGACLNRAATPVREEAELPEASASIECAHAGTAVPGVSQAHTLLTDAIEKARRDGLKFIGPRYFYSSGRVTIPRSRAWISAQLSHLADAGQLHRTQTPGIYTFASKDTP